MKELSIEQKAQRYDEAIERARALICGETETNAPVYYVDNIKDLFPELKESEDEKIRNTIIEILSHHACYNGITGNDMLAWLEKQGKKESDPRDKYLNELLVADNIYQMSMNDNMVQEARTKAVDALSKICIGKLLGFEKQGEHANFRNKIQIGDQVTRNEDGVLVNLSQLKRVAKRGDYLKAKSALEAIKEEKVDNRNCVKPTNKVEPLRIKSGNWYVCIKDYQFCEHDYPTFEKGKIYKSNKDGEVIAEDGGKWPFGNAKDFFRIATQEEIKSMLNPADKVEPKFHEGEWVVWEKRGSVYQIKNCIEDVINHKYGYELTNGGYIASCDVNHYHLWTIQDAKDGDVLHTSSFSSDCIFIFDRLDKWKFDEPNGERAVATGHCCLTLSANNMEFGIQGPDCIEIDTVKPATKEQRDALEKAMADAGYTFDFEKKELKKNNSYCQENCKGYQQTGKCYCDGDCKAKIEAEQNPTWNEEDELHLANAILAAEKEWGCDSCTSKWLKSLKDRVQPQNHWKPSKEQMKVLDEVIRNPHLSTTEYDGLIALKEKLKEL